MPKGPRGEKRPADVIGNAIRVARIATGEESEEVPKENKSRAGRAGAAARTLKLSPEQRADIARLAAEARWKKD